MPFGASILPVTIINNQIFFLFGKERDDDDKPGWSDFGGGQEPNDTNYFDTATREGAEELTGFLGQQKHIKQLLLKYGTFIIDYHSNYKNQKSNYRVHIFPIQYNPFLTLYFNNNYNFLQSHINNQILRKYRIFEKTQIKWFNFKQLLYMKNQFRHFYQDIIQLIFKYKQPITQFIKSSLTNLHSHKLYNKTKTKTKTHKTKLKQTHKTKTKTKH